MIVSNSNVKMYEVEVRTRGKLLTYPVGASNAYEAKCKVIGDNGLRANQIVDIRG